MKKEIGGFVYEKRFSPTDHWTWYGTEDPLSEPPQHVLCGKCETPDFTLVYGDYEIFAVCSKCGRKDSVYSG
jgi:hypothetical protein